MLDIMKQGFVFGWGFMLAVCAFIFIVKVSERLFK
jgi:hypothetical protein